MVVGRSSIVASFGGITIKMFPLNHFPPHFHAEYVGKRITLRISDLHVLSGSFPPPQLAELVEWARLRQPALVANWERIRRGEYPDEIE